MLRLLKATLNSWNGLRAAARSEEAFRQELVMFILALPAAFLVTTDTWRRIALIGVIVLLMIVELLNTAIEKLAGTISSVSTVDEIMPPTIGTAMRLITSLPVPLLQRIGSSPAMMVPPA